MKLAPAQLGKHLQGTLAPVYVVCGDEALLCQEATDAIRSASRAQGFTEREVFHAEANFDWGMLYEAGASMSLFAEKRVIELRIPNGKPGDKGAAAILEYLSRPPEDTLLLVSLPKLDGSAQKTKWAKALIDGPHCQFVQIWPVDANALPQWIRQRLAQAGMNASAEAIDLIAARVEGNLLAAAQEIEKLKLLADGQQIDAGTVQAAVADSARYDVFGLIDAILNGEAAHALRMLDGLRGEGQESLFIVVMLARELRQLANISYQYSQGVPLDKAFASARPPVWDKRRPLVSKALQRHTPARWNTLLMDAQQIDAQVKGQAAGDPWASLSRLVLMMAGQRLKLGA
ncbi:DNA polymerase III subunit delta [Phytopseudomonas punonensis]|uniref:DNA polymerase III subunit delta n=1 Tax=Phytopseudomonas punonensis TaxID=1220495 RepID=A0A1M6XE25_9GAMM|nr:DNA polymerase III subunit delta [Pseudomonas punonensis]SHL04099.1 DNA polymerase III, delta subunit [Pseudomonas punonensis]